MTQYANALTRRCIVAAFENGYSVDKLSGMVISKTGRKLSGCLRKNGYIAVCVFIKGLTGPRGYQINVHQLIAFSKFGMSMFEDKIEVRHLDGNRTNNKAENIEIGTRSENMMDMPSAARSARNKEKVSPRRVLSNNEASLVRKAYDRGLAWGECTRLAEMLSVSTTTISEIGRRKTYNA